MAVTFKLSLDLDAPKEVLSQVRARAGDLRPALRTIAAAGVRQTTTRFQLGRGPDGAAWKKGRKTSGQTLIDTTLLMRSISPREPEAGAVEWGSNRIYARIHQLGGTIVAKAGGALRFKIGQAWVSVKKVVIPARPYLGVNDQDMAEFGSILLRHVGEPMGAVEGGGAA